MDQKIIFLTILGMAVVTYLPRLLPTWLLTSKSLPPLVTEWLKFVPVAVLAAMLLPSLVIQDEQIYLQPDNLYLLAAIPVALVAWKARSFFGAVAAGMLLVAGLRYFM